MKKQKLQLHRTTIRVLTQAGLRRAAGGTGGITDVCDTRTLITQGEDCETGGIRTRQYYEC